MLDKSLYLVSFTDHPFRCETELLPANDFEGGLQFSRHHVDDVIVRSLFDTALFIREINFGKVYAKFRRALWPEDKEYLVLVSKGEEKRGHYPFWMKYKNTSDNILMCYLGGAEARRVELLSLESIKDEIEAVFRKALGNADEDCRPLSVAVTDWSKNPHTCGSYSYYPKGAFGTISRDDLQRGLNGSTGDDDPSHPTTLYFAGEAFDNKFNGWVQGGYLSGERTAHMILDEYRT